MCEIKSSVKEQKVCWKENFADAVGDATPHPRSN